MTDDEAKKLLEKAAHVKAVVGNRDMFANKLDRLQHCDYNDMILRITSNMVILEQYMTDDSNYEFGQIPQQEIVEMFRKQIKDKRDQYQAELERLQ